MVNGYPWGTKSPSTSDSYTQAPDTGVIRSYDFTIARGVLAPDGFSKSLLLVNGQYPGVGDPPRAFLQLLIKGCVACDRSQLGRHYSSDRQQRNHQP